MKKTKKINKALVLLASSFLLFGCGTTNTITNTDNVNSDSNSSQDIPDQTDSTEDIVNIEDNTTSTTTDEETIVDVPADAKALALVQDGTVAIDGVSVADNVITIEQAGSYVLSGNLSDGYVYINKDINVHLYLNGVSISTSTGSPLIFMKDSKSESSSVITLVKNTSNVLSDANLADYTSGDYDDGDAEFKNNAALFAKRALTINGEGSLSVTSYFHQGIRCKSNLKVLDGNIEVNAYDNGIKGDTNVSLLGGTINVVSSNGDGVKTDEAATDDEYDETLYNAKFSNVDLTIDAKYDGIQVYNMINFESGNFDITTWGGLENRADYLNNPELDDAGNVVYEDGEISYPSAKAIKTGLDWSDAIASGASSIYFKEGTYKIDAVDDAVNANNLLVVESGEFNIQAGDDGMHADASFVMNDGTINVTDSYEGLEAANMEFNGGTVSVVSDDDGINASNKHGTVADGAYDEACQMYFNGTNITVDAEGDGIDSNGCAQFNAGTVVVNGPTNNGNSAIDTNGGFVVNGGTLISLGTSGMLEVPKTNGTQYSATVSATFQKGTTFAIKDDNGNEIASFSAIKTGNALTFSSSDLVLNGVYHLYVNGSETLSWTQDSISYSSITTQNGPGEGQPGGQGQPGGGNRG